MSLLVYFDQEKSLIKAFTVLDLDNSIYALRAHSATSEAALVQLCALYEIAR